MPAGTAGTSSPPWMPPDRHPSSLILEYHPWISSRQLTAESSVFSLLLGLTQCRSFLLAILRLTTLSAAREKEDLRQTNTRCANLLSSIWSSLVFSLMAIGRFVVEISLVFYPLSR
jgi:hypothetical protein